MPSVRPIWPPFRSLRSLTEPPGNLLSSRAAWHTSSIKLPELLAESPDVGTGDEHELAERLRKLQRRAERAASELDAIAYESGRVVEVRRHVGSAKRKHPPAAPTRPRRPQTDEGRALAEQAERGAASLEVRRRDRGSADVRVDGGRWFRLPALLAEVLSLIADPTRGTPGEDVPWQPHERLCRLLSTSPRASSHSARSVQDHLQASARLSRRASERFPDS